MNLCQLLKVYFHSAPLPHTHLWCPLQCGCSLLQLERRPLVASAGNHTAAAAAAVCCGRAEASGSAAPSHTSPSCWGLRPASRAWSRRWAPPWAGRGGPAGAAGSGRSRNTTPRRASAAPRTSSGPGRYLSEKRGVCVRMWTPVSLWV